jgi:hypothetical protein
MQESARMKLHKKITSQRSVEISPTRTKKESTAMIHVRMTTNEIARIRAYAEKHYSGNVSEAIRLVLNFHIID